MKYTQIGKPFRPTYEFAEAMLRKHARSLDSGAEAEDLSV